MEGDGEGCMEWSMYARGYNWHIWWPKGRGGRNNGTADRGACTCACENLLIPGGDGWSLEPADTCVYGAAISFVAAMARSSSKQLMSSHLEDGDSALNNSLFKEKWGQTP